MATNPLMRFPVGSVGQLLIAKIGWDALSWLLEQEAVRAWLKDQWGTVKNGMWQKVQSASGRLIETVLGKSEKNLGEFAERIMSGIYASYVDAYEQAPDVLSRVSAPDGSVIVLETAEEYADFMMLPWEEFREKWPERPPPDEPVEALPVNGTAPYGEWASILYNCPRPLAAPMVQIAAGIVGIAGVLMLGTTLVWLGWRR